VAVSGPSLDRTRANEAADVLLESFESLMVQYRAMSARARSRFCRREWAEFQADSTRRLDLYGASVERALARVGQILGERTGDRSTWQALRDVYAPSVLARPDAELAETFFNSLTRKIFHTVGVDPSVEFVGPPADGPAHGPPWTLTLRVERGGDGLEGMFHRLLDSFPFAAPWDDLDADARRIAERVRATLDPDAIRAVEVVRHPFFREQGAHVVGKLETDSGETPFLVSLRNPEGAILVDAVLLAADEVSIVFSFARSYFFVVADRPRELVDFLRTIMPRKAIAELYNAIGWNKHGKTELYRSILHHLDTTDDRFRLADGQRGMVMAVFTLPGFDVVFKVLRDRFQEPKTVTHREVREKYRLVFRHDRAGRLVDAQEFEHFEFDLDRFEPELLAELLETASEAVSVRDGRVDLKHLYTERRLRPLDLYMRAAPFEAAREAVLEYGQALKDLAATNIFPGDMLLKNFGVSRHGRLIFYDYDELCLLTDCRFRELPTARDDWDDGAAEPSFYVAEGDVFPEEFRSFLGLEGRLLEVFLDAHADLLTPAYWRRIQERIRCGEVMDVLPYRAERRLSR
jgi:isocitrate dehydrogenase kinase/phosphatase